MRLALPSKGEMEEPTLQFLEACGLAIGRPSPRHYVADMAALPGVAVLFQRTADIVTKVEEGSADLGITGLDIVREQEREDTQVMVLMENLGYSRCDLLLAVPDSWVDVSTAADLADICLDFRDSGRELRIATKYPGLTQRFLRAKGIHHFVLVEARGALEAAPAVGYADLIADLASTGTTLRENHLKTLGDGTILRSQACLIGNRQALHADAEKLETAGAILELFEAKLRAQSYYTVTANVRGPSAEAVAAAILEKEELAGIKGPTIARVYGKTPSEDWYAVTVVVGSEMLLPLLQHLRQKGASTINTSTPTYVFRERSEAYHRLLRALKRTRRE